MIDVNSGNQPILAGGSAATANAPYGDGILGLAGAIPHQRRLPRPAATAEKRSVVCGSRVLVDVDMDSSGRVADVGLVVRACVLGEASASVLARNVIGRTAGELESARMALAAWLAGIGEKPDWPLIEHLAQTRPFTARHASIRLAFEAAAEAAHNADSNLLDVVPDNA